MKRRLNMSEIMARIGGLVLAICIIFYPSFLGSVEDCNSRKAVESPFGTNTVVYEANI